MAYRKPNFFLVGAPKAGTTSIHDMLSMHPQMFLSEEKELHYFCSDIHRNSDQFHGKIKFFLNRSLHDFEQNFNSSNEKIVIGESSTSYFYSADAAKKIYDFNPDAKILISLRDPVELMYSWYNYLKSRSDEHMPSFQEAYELQNKRSNDNQCISTACMAPIRLQYDLISNFNLHISRFYSIFPRASIKIVLFEDFVKDSSKVIEEILDFLEVESYEIPELKSNEKKSVRFSFIKRLVDTYLVSQKQALAENNNIIVKCMRKIYHKGIFTKSIKEEKPHDYLSSIRRKYRNDIELLSKVIDRDLLSIWSYRHAPDTQKQDELGLHSHKKNS